jgi:hypothetical protein
MAREAVARLAAMATADTMQFGEVFVTTQPAGATAPVFSQRVAAPHVWEGTLFYLAAMALTSGAFDAEIGAMPLPTPRAAVLVAGGCEEAGGSGRTFWPLAALVAGLAAVARARRRAS